VKKYALSQRTKETYDAAGKAMRDVYDVLGQKGFQTIWSMPKQSKKYLKILDLPYLAAFLLFRAGKGDFVFYSIPENKIKIKMLKAFRKIRGYKVICFINDLLALRQGQDLPEHDRKRLLEEELALVEVGDYVLAPNDNMASYLKEQGVKSKLISIGVWDYMLSDETVGAIRKKQAQAAESREQGTVKIGFAGNLNKSEFLQKLPFTKEQGISFELWGLIKKDTEQELAECCHYNGLLSSEEVPLAVCTMDYGLVWDGSGSNETGGNFGTYLRYCNNHKSGLYLASGIPVIGWSESGLSYLVQKYQCGILIDRLSDIPEKLADADHEALKKNAERVAEMVRKGEFLSRAIDEVIET
jgi:hypothetical protein